MTLDDHFKPKSTTRVITDRRILEVMKRQNNPSQEPSGHYTGRCQECHSTNLWDDNTRYGCRDCGAVYLC